MSQKQITTRKESVKQSTNKKDSNDHKSTNKEKLLNNEKHQQVKEDLKQTKKNLMPNDLKDVLKFNNGLGELKNKIDSEISTLKQLKGELKKLETNYQQDLLKVWKSKKKRATNGDKTGFIKNKKLPNKLALLIGVPEGTEMSMPAYTSKFYEEVLNKKNLLFDKDKRVFRADKELMELFDLPESVNQSNDYKDKKGFNFSTLQKYFSKIMKEEEEDQDQDQDQDHDNNSDRVVELKTKIVTKKNKEHKETKELKA